MKTCILPALVACCFCLLGLLPSLSAQEAGKPEVAAASPPPSSPAAPNLPSAGIGVALGKDAEGFFVAAVLPDSAAAASKLIQKGDRILGVAKAGKPMELLAGRTELDVVKMIRGAEGTQLRLSVAPGAGEISGPGQPMEVSLTRGDLGMRTAPEAGEPAPDLSYLRLGDGQTVSLATTHRGKIVVLEFWATWCGPCQPVVTELQQTAAKFAAQKDRIEFVTLNSDSHDDIEETQTAANLEKVKAHVRKQGWTQTTQGFATEKQMRPWGVRHWPNLYIIGADGKIIAHDPKEDLNELLARLLAR